MPPLEFNQSLYAVKGIVILDESGNILLTKYYSDDLKEKSRQEEVETVLLNTTKTDDGRLVIFKEYIILYKELCDFTVYVIGGTDENEIILQGVLNTLCGALTLTIKPTLDKAALMRKYDKLVLALDQTIDNGIILSLNEEEVASRISAGGSGIDLFSSEQLIFQYIQKAQEHLVNSLI